jgi:hypothetical protein
MRGRIRVHEPADRVGYRVIEEHDQTHGDYVALALTFLYVAAQRLAGVRDVNEGGAING